MADSSIKGVIIILGDQLCNRVKYEGTLSISVNMIWWKAAAVSTKEYLVKNMHNSHST